MRRRQNKRDLFKIRPIDVGCIYDYGWPAGGNPESNVLEQWIFDEASGSIVGEVNSVTLAASGTPDYNQEIEGDFECLSPGINYAAAEYHSLGSPTAALDIGTSDITVEAVLQFDSGIASKDGHIFSTVQVSDSKGINVQFDRDFMGIWMKADDATVTNFQATFSSGDTLDLNTPHKFRIAVDRDVAAGGTKGYVNGVEEVSGNPAAQLGKTLSNYTTFIAARSDYPTDSSREFVGIIHELRLSAALNNSGGPGGG